MALPIFSPGSSGGGGGGLELASLTVTTSGDVADGGSQDVAIALPARCVVLMATLTTTSGAPTGFGMVAYAGDPAVDGVAIAAILGTTFGQTVSLTDGACAGPRVPAGAADIISPVPLAGCTHIRFYNGGGAGAAQVSVDLDYIDLGA